jgi:glycosyltransferase involved in cell wall biosynthesis
MCGPSRAAVSGVATRLNQLFDSSLSDKYTLIQFQVGSEGREEGRLQEMLRYLRSPIEFVAALIRFRPAIVHLNTSIEAIATLRRGGGESFRFQIAGSGPDEGFLRQLVSEKGVEDIVEFLGPVFGEDKMRFWEGIDIFGFPTFHREGLPYTILEALASGTPTLSTRVGGIPDVIQNSVQGVLFDDHDPDSVARTIEAMLSDRQRLREMSVAAMQRGAGHYGVERLASQFDRIYQELLA